MAQVTPEERARLRALCEPYTTVALGKPTLHRQMASGIRDLLDALDAAENEVERLRDLLPDAYHADHVGRRAGSMALQLQRERDEARKLCLEAQAYLSAAFIRGELPASLAKALAAWESSQ